MRIVAEGSEIIIKDGTIINAPVYIFCMKKIEIGSKCLIAQGVTIRDHDGHKLGYDNKRPIFGIEGIIIEDQCWISQNVIILKGVTVGKGSVIAAGSVVTKDVPQHTLVAGVPAKVIKKNVKWEA